MILIEKALDCFKVEKTTPGNYVELVKKREHIAYTLGHSGRMDNRPMGIAHDSFRAPTFKKKPAEAEAFMLLYSGSLKFDNMVLLPMDEVEDYFKMKNLHFRGFVHRGGAWGKVTLAVSEPEELGVWVQGKGTHALALLNRDAVVRIGGACPKAVVEKFIAEQNNKR